MVVSFLNVFKKMKLEKLIIIAGFFCSLTALGQDTLRFLNGNILLANIHAVEERDVVFSLQKKQKRSLLRREKSLIFSYTKQAAKEIVLYEYKPEHGNIYQVEEMRDYMLGERHADEYYHSRFYSYLSFATGVLAGYAVADDNALAIVSPIVFSSIIIIPGAKVRRNELNKTLLENGPYRSGYKRVARGRKFMKSLKYGAIGMLSSLVLFRIAD